MDIATAHREFRAMVARRVLETNDGTTWVLHDWGTAGEEPPLVCLHGLACSEGELFRPQLILGAKGYRTIVCRMPVVWDLPSFVRAFDQLLLELKCESVHLLGVHLGGLCLQAFAAEKPRRVRSLALLNSYCDTTDFQFALGSLGIQLMPTVFLSKFILDEFPDEEIEHAPDVAAAIDFAVEEVEALSFEELASRLTLHSSTVDSARFSRIDSSKVTLIHVADQKMLHGRHQDALVRAYPSARVATIKSGGDFICLTAPDEVAMHLIVHLRRHSTAAPARPAAPPPNEGSGDEHCEQQFDAPPPQTYVAV